MDAFKGVFRRATQSVREKVGSAEGSGDPQLIECVSKIHSMEKSTAIVSQKLMQLSKLLEDVGTVLGELGEEYKRFSAEINGSSSVEISQLAVELSAFGSEFNTKAQETGRQLKENAFDPLSAFIRETPQLKTLEEDRKKKQLEFDFFNTKTAELIKTPPKDAHDRIPRNESIRESWRVQLHQATETMKVAAGSIYTQGLKALDMAVYTTAIATGNLLNYGLSSVKVHFANARIPVYQTAPVLAPSPLPPPPPRWIPPAPQYNYPSYPQPTAGSPPQAPPGAAGSPGGVDPYHQQQQPQPQMPASWGSPQQAQQPPPQQYQQPPPQQQAPPAGWQQPPPQHAPPVGWQQQQQQAPPNASFAGPSVPNNSFAQHQQYQQPPQQFQQQPPPTWNSPPAQQHQQAPPAQQAPPPQFNPFEPAPSVAQGAPYVPPPKVDDGMEPPPM